MKYTMYHKNLPTVTFNLTEKGYIDNILSIENVNHIHPFLLTNGKLDSSDNYYPLYDKILRWMKERNIPASRKNLSSALSTLGVKSTDELALYSFYLSLSDQYWIAPTELHLNWEKINFYKNDFSEDVGKALFGEINQKEIKYNLHSPDPSTNGQLVKKWVIENGERILVKGGSGTEQLEPFNEVLASEICKRLGLEHVEYSLHIENRKHFCKCNNFTTEDTEYITVADICDDIADWKNGFVSYEHFKDRCNLLGIKLDEKELGKMFVVDYLIANEDRHLNNFGFIRNSNDLSWKGLCPIYDSGSSMFYNLSDFELDSKLGLENNKIQCKPFSENYIKQLLLFPLKDCINELHLDNLNDIGTFYKELLQKNQRNISKEKIDKLSSCLQNRVTLLQEIQKARTIKNLPIVASFNSSLKSYDNKSDFTEFLKEKYQEAIDNNSFKKELLSFYLFGLNSKDEKDFEKKIKNILIHKHGIENLGYER
ncbi:MAG: hypothetical protein BKP49_10790 [Treponema sp. CETP13]|nr:MAG: hypothetical protein BKP49_10790 [Treponema sp. CETP13]